MSLSVLDVDTPGLAGDVPASTIPESDLPAPTFLYKETSSLPIVLTNTQAVPEPASLVLIAQAIGAFGPLA